MSRRAVGFAVLGVLVGVAVFNSLTRPPAEPATLAEAVQLTVAGVDSTAYAVTADVVVRNAGRDAVSVVDFVTIGVAISARGGLPERVPGRAARTLHLHLQIPRCEGLPGRFGGFDLTVQHGSERIDIGYISEPGTPLYREMTALADRTCAAYRNR